MWLKNLRTRPASLASENKCQQTPCLDRLWAKPSQTSSTKGPCTCSKTGFGFAASPFSPGCYPIPWFEAHAPVAERSRSGKLKLSIALWHPAELEFCFMHVQQSWKVVQARPSWFEPVSAAFEGLTLFKDWQLPLSHFAFNFVPFKAQYHQPRRKFSFETFFSSPTSSGLARARDNAWIVETAEVQLWRDSVHFEICWSCAYSVWNDWLSVLMIQASNLT